MISVSQAAAWEALLTKLEIERKLAAHRNILRKMGVVSLAVFGSVARNEYTSKSDVDLLVEFDRDISLFYFFEIQHKLEDIIGVSKVDLLQKGAIHPALKEKILSEAVNVA